MHLEIKKKTEQMCCEWSSPLNFHKYFLSQLDWLEAKFQAEEQQNKQTKTFKL